MIDFLIALIFVSLNLIMILSNYNLLEYLYEKGLSNADKIIISLILYFAKIYFILFVLGSIGSLNIGFVFILVILIEGLISIIYYKRRTFILPEINFNFSFLLQKPLLLIAFCFLSSLYLYALLKGTITPPFDGDSMLYHMPAVVNWFKTESLLNTQTPFGYYPLNGAILSLWLMFPFNNDVLVNYQNVLPTVLCLLVVYKINSIYLDKEWNLWVIISLFSIFIIPYQLFTQLNDVLILTFFCSALYGLFNYHQSRKIIFLIISGISLGVLIGLKYNMVAYSILIFAPLFISVKSVRISERLKDVFIMILLGIVFGGFWYIRNWILLDSPIYPLSLSLVEMNIFKPIILKSIIENFNPESTALITHIFDIRLWYFILLNVVKAGVIFLFFIPLLILSFVKLSKYRIPYKSVFLFLLFYSFLIVFLTPYSAENIDGTLNMIKDYYQFVRFGLIGFYLLLLLGFILFSNVKDSNKSLSLQIIILLSSLISIFFALPGILQKYHGLILFVFVMFNLSIILLLYKVSFRILNFISLTIFIILFSVFVVLLNNYKDFNRSKFYNNYFNKQIEIYDKSTNLLTWYYNNVHNKKVMVYGLRSYPFYGLEFENDILFDNKIINHNTVDYIITARDFTNSHSDKFGKLPDIDKSLKNDDNIILIYEDDLANVYKSSYWRIKK